MNLFAALNSDGYKLGHADMYADGTTKVYSNLTPRSDKIYRRGCTRFYDGRLVFFGGQMAVKEVVDMWYQTFFSQRKEDVIGLFKEIVDAYLGADVISTKRLEALHDLGYLPLEIKTLDEGLKVPMGIPVLTITNTIDEHFWLVNYLETLLSNLTWKTSTNATIAAEYKAILKHYAEKTGVDDFTVSIQAHDFSARGMSGPEDSSRSGTAHLTQFIGTDTLSSILAVKRYYGCNGLLAISVPATEHAVATNNILSIEQGLLSNEIGYVNGTRLEAEKLFMKDLITRKFPKGIVSYVADSFDFWAVLTKILPQIKDVILDRQDDANGLAKLVIRPDSGDPVKVVCGYKWSGREYKDAEELEMVSRHQDKEVKDDHGPESDEWFQEVVNVGGIFYNVIRDGHGFVKPGNETFPEHEVKGAIQVLWEIFGGTQTATGHNLLDRHIGLIYGDSITTKRAEEILERLEQKGFASGNVVFGVGSYTYQCNTRDTFGFAVKATYSVVNGEAVNIFKDPKTDAKKKSAKGLMYVGKPALFNNNGDLTGYGEMVLNDEVSAEIEADRSNMLKCRFKDGHWFNQVTFDVVRERLA